MATLRPPAHHAGYISLVFVDGGGIKMLWRPSTYGESLFLEIYASLGAAISVESEYGFDYLVSGRRFKEFARHVASLEVFYRCLRCSERFSREQAHLPATSLAKELRLTVELPAALYNNKRFLEVAKQAGRIVHEARIFTPGVERDLWRSEPFQCYLCGNTLLDKGKDNPKYKSIDHLWPLSLGGQSSLENLLPACQGCNNSRGHAVTWAMGPVAAYHLPKTGANFPASWKFALAMFSLTKIAQAERRPLSLKEAARRARPIVPNIDTSERTPFVFFETILELEMAD
jgi:5-methylcytosine-specific restriction endonuclease McrA